MSISSTEDYLDFAAAGSDATRRGSYTDDECIRRLSLFRKCDPRFITEVSPSFTVEVFRPGQVVVREGDKNSCLWVVHRGSVEVSEKGRRIRQLEDGDCFGEAQLLGVRRFNIESMRARTFVDMRVLSREGLAQALAHFPYERLLFSHMAVSLKLELVVDSKRIEDGTGNSINKECKHRELEDQKVRLEQIIGRGRKSALAAVGRESLTKADILGHMMGFDLEPHDPDCERSSIKPRYVNVQEPLPGCWQTLSDWHRMLAASPEGRRLNLWQLDYYNRDSPAPGARGPASRCSRYSFTSDGSRTWRGLGSRAGSPGSRRESNSVMAGSSRFVSSRQPPRPHTVASTIRTQQPPYPRLPPTTQRDPACVRNGCRKSIYGSIPPFSARSCGRRPPMDNKTPEAPGRPGSDHWWSVDLKEEDASPAGVAARALVKQPASNVEVPPGLGEAIAELSRCLLRSQWHCENLARERSRSASASASPGPGGSPPPERRRHGSRSVEFCEEAPSRQTTDEDLPVPHVGLTLPPLNNRPVSLTPARRLEVTLRGTFRTEDGPDSGAADDCGAYTEDTEQDTAQNVTPRANSAMTCSKEEDSMRAMMGFGRDEVGSTPSGRTSVPAMRQSSSGALSAPPLHGGPQSVDEGIDLASLEQCVEQHVLRILERGLHAPSRAASCEPQESMSPSPMPRCFSPTTSLCASPTPRSEEVVTVCIRARLCQTRCGSSSAVLALSLDHGPDCNEVSGCCCWPSPEDSEARLLAFFARRSWLRLTSSQRPVRVLLEPLADAYEEAQQMSMSFSATTASAGEEHHGGVGADE